MTLDVRALNFEPDRVYGLAILALGYEDRATHLLSCGLNASRIVAIPFGRNRVLSYESNAARIRDAGGTLLYVEEAHELRGVCLGLAAGMPDADSQLILVDISSFDRTRLAELVLALQDASTSLERELEVHFFYSPGSFEDPPASPPSVLSAGPVGPRFRGPLQRSSIPVGAVFGLGYEPQRALGAFELLEPARAWAFTPQGVDSRYENAIIKANSQLLDSLGADHIVTYNVLDGASVYYTLDSFIFSMSERFRLILIPMGPKLFALCCFLIGIEESARRPAVWRVGERVQTQLVDAHAVGQVVGVGVVFKPVSAG